MHEGFIEVTELEPKVKCSFNIDHIIAVVDQGRHACIVTTRSDEHKMYTLVESYETVMCLIVLARRCVNERG